jgi:hypothetical protein
LVVASGKNNPNIYVLDRDNMGKFNPNADNIYQLLAGVLSSGGEFGKPSYFNNTVYYGAVGDSLKAFPITSGRLATTPSSQSSNQFPYPGTTPTISANGAASGIVWAVENGNTAVLHAYDATNLASELYNSNQAANSRDQFAGNKFITPMVANGRVYIGTPNSVVVLSFSAYCPSNVRILLEPVCTVPGTLPGPIESEVPSGLISGQRTLNLV